MSGFELPARIDGLLAVASQLFANQGKTDHVRIITNARLEIEEGIEDNDWNSGQHGHQVNLLLPPALAHYALCEKPNFGAEICEVLRRLSHVPGEHITSVAVCADHQAVSTDWRRESGTLLDAPALASSNAHELTRIWQGTGFRVFLSHRADFKVEVSKLRTELSSFGAGSFVAHEDIQPTKAWQSEIERALNSMDVLVAVLSNGFCDSYWTNQEIGVALGRGVPVICLRLDEDPPGFVSSTQAVNGRGKLVVSWASDLINVFAQHPGLSGRLLNALVPTWEAASSYAHATKLMTALENYQRVPTPLLERIEAAYAVNSQLHDCWNIGEPYPSFVSRARATQEGKAW